METIWKMQLPLEHSWAILHIVQLQTRETLRLNRL